MYCHKCGNFLAPDTLFCPKCGEKAVLSQGANQANQKTWSNPQGGAYQSPPNQQNNRDRSWKGNSGYQPNAQRAGNSNLVCALGFIPFLFWLPLVVEKDNRLARHTANQGLLLLIVSLIQTVLQRIVSEVFSWGMWNFPFNMANGLLRMIFGAVLGIIGIFVLVCVIIGFVKALKGEEFEVPIIGKCNIIN